jgi:hypothetical protein
VMAAPIGLVVVWLGLLSGPLKRLGGMWWLEGDLGTGDEGLVFEHIGALWR